MKKPLSLLLALSLLLSPVKANPLPSIELSSPSAILIEQETGEILFEKEAHTPLSPASVTKIMTILLIMEGITDGTLHPDDMVYTSSTASSMGGSQVFLSAGESMTVWEMLKCVVVSSANDASVALAEHLCGSESAFVALMNQRAEELGMTNTTFQNATGLPHDHHLTTAYDISLMSRELMFNHPDIQDLTTIWMDTIRGGEFGLSNTNRLIHSYNGATGLKTGSTDSALYCLSATAERDDLALIAVILKAPTSEERFEDATKLLDYGFATYALHEVHPQAPIPPMEVILGNKSYLQPALSAQTRLLLLKSQISSITTEILLPETVEAPVVQGQILGSLMVRSGDTLLAELPFLATEEVPRLTTLALFWQLLRTLVMAEG